MKYAVWIFISFVLLVTLRLIFIYKKQQDDLKIKTLFYQTTEKRTSKIVFLHGILGSHRYWDKFIPELGLTHELILLDLLGFGNSPKPGFDYTVVDHLDKIKATLDNLNKEPGQKYSLVGHSMGAVLALNYAKNHTEEVERLILINPPIDTSIENLKNSMIESSSKVIVQMTFNPLFGRAVCFVHELIPFLAYPLIGIFEPELPAAMATDATKHTWKSYMGSMKHVLEEQKTLELIQNVKNIPTLILMSDKDEYSKSENLDILKDQKNVRIKIVNGEHSLPLFHPERIMPDIQSFLK